MEKWVDVNGYEGLYLVSNRGQIKRVGCGKGAKAGRVLKFYLMPNGYCQITLTKNCTQKKYYVHRVVIESFLEPRPNETVNHINGDKLDNRPENLEYMSRSENTKHSNRVLGNLMQGERNGNSKLTETMVLEIISMLGEKSHTELSRLYGVSRPTITEIAIGRKWKHLSVPLVSPF